MRTSFTRLNCLLAMLLLCLVSGNAFGEDIIFQEGFGSTPDAEQRFWALNDYDQYDAINKSGVTIEGTARIGKNRGTLNTDNAIEMTNPTGGIGGFTFTIKGINTSSYGAKMLSFDVKGSKSGGVLSRYNVTIKEGNTELYNQEFEAANVYFKKEIENIPASATTDITVTLLNETNLLYIDNLLLIPSDGQAEKQVATPTFTTVARTFTEPTLKVELACETADAGIRYTTDGTEPTETSALYEAATGISIDRTTTIKAIAFKEGMTASEVASATFTKKVIETEMTVDASAISGYPEHSLEEVLNLTLTGTWGTTEKDLLMKAIKPTSQTAVIKLKEATFATDAVVNNMSSFFDNCRNLETVTLPETVNASSVDFNKAFYNCWGLREVKNLDKFTNISKMEYAFASCMALTTFTMPVVKNATAISFKYAFQSCKALATEVDLSAFINITDLSWAFSSAAKLPGVKMPTEVNTNEISFQETFRSASELTAVDLSAFTKIVSLEGTFQDCFKLTSVKFPEVENTQEVNLKGAFTGCKAYSAPIDLSIFSDVINYHSTFSGCISLTEIKLSEKENGNPLTMQATFNKTAITSMDLSKLTNITKLAFTFGSCPQLTSVTFPERNENVTDVSSLFEKCTSMTKGDLSMFPNISNLTSTFFGCTAIKEVVLPEDTVSASAQFVNTFAACTALDTPIDLSRFTNISYFQNAFDGCTSLPEVKLSAKKHAAKAFKQTFRNCSALVAPVDLSGFGCEETNINMTETFSGCTLLPAVKMLADINENNLILEKTFAGCAGLREPLDFRGFTAAKELTNAFEGCTSLPAVLFGNIPPVIDNAFKDANPNCLKYLPAVPEDEQLVYDWTEVTNVVLDGKARADMALEDGYPFYCPVAFEMGEWKISYLRDFTGNFANKTQGWNTICLPFDAKLTAGGGVVPYAGAEKGYWLRELKAATVDSLGFTEVEAIKANTPYILALPGNEIKDMSSMEGKDILFSATGITVPATPEKLVGNTVHNFACTGTYKAIVGQPMYVLERGTEKNADAFIYTETGSVEPFRAYVTALNDEAQKTTVLKLDKIAGSITGISTVADNTDTRIYMADGVLTIDTAQAATVAVYGTDGRMVRIVELQEGTNKILNLNAGVYIVAGHKVVVGF